VSSKNAEIFTRTVYFKYCGKPLNHLIASLWSRMSRIKTVIVFGKAANRQLKVRSVNRAKSKCCWFDGSLVENNLPHFRVNTDAPVPFSEPVSISEAQNNDGSSSSLAGIGWGNSTWESFEDYNLGSSQYENDFEASFWN
jgi:hypothetical protein